MILSIRPSALATITMWALTLSLTRAAEPSPTEQPPPEDGVAILDRAVAPMTDDLDAMRRLGRVRVLVSFSRTNFFVSQGRPRGFDCDLMTEYQRALLTQLKMRRGDMSVVFVPVPFGQLIPALLEGRGDIAAGGLTVTAEREKLVAFSDPYLSDVDEIVVASKGLRDLKSLDDLAGRTVRVVRGSSYVDHLKRLSDDLQFRGRAAVDIVQADPSFEAEDLLEMVHAGAADLTVVDRPIADAWAQVLPGLDPRLNLKVNSGGKLALAVRPNNPQLLASVNAFVLRHRRGTTLGNVLFRRYFANTRWLTNPMSEQQRRRRDELEALFRKYGKQYHFDWLLLAAQAYQESAFDPAARSDAGAVGIMQVRPATAAELGVEPGRLVDPDSNIRAGAMYLAKLRDTYFSDPALDPAARSDFTFAAYNAGAANVRKWRDLAAERGADPDRWRGNVERVSLEIVGEQTYRYVRNINKYYVIYTELAASTADRDAARRTR
jgi:membrane-bound lytic murein transglycosylase MltF